MSIDLKYDLRIIRTYKSLTEAFLQLMSEKHFEAITINELCERAMIRRTTFYKHFADKYDFFRFFVWQLQTNFDAINPTADYGDPLSFFVGIIRHVTVFIKENEQLISMALHSNLLPTLIDILSEQIISNIMEKIKIGEKKGFPGPASPEIFATFFTNAIIHTFKWWLNQKKPIPEEKLIQEIEKILLA